MDPIMRKWLQSLSNQPLKTELDWQNRANNNLNETVYGIVAKKLLNEGEGSMPRGERFARMSDKDFETWVRQNPGAEETARRLRADGQESLRAKVAAKMVDQPLPVDTKPDITQSPSTKQSGELINKVGRSADTAVLGAFGALGAADLPTTIDNIFKSEKDLKDTGVYGYNRLGSGWKWDETKNDFVKMPENELKTKSEALHAMDYGKLVGDAAITTSAAIQVPSKTLPEILDMTKKTKTGELLSKVTQKVSEVPGVSRFANLLPTVAKVANTIFPAAVVYNKAGRLVGQISDDKLMDAAKTGIESSFWAGELAAPGNKVSSAGIGHELLHTGAKGLYSKAKEGKLDFDVSTGVDLLNTGLGAYMTQVPAISKQKAADEAAKKVATATGKAITKVGEKEALEIGEKLAAKSLLKGAAKQIPIAGVVAAAPFAIHRAIEGDWSGAALELAGAIPIAGLGAQGYLAVRDYEKEMEKLANQGAKKAEAQDIRDELKFQAEKAKKEKEDIEIQKFSRGLYESIIRKQLKSRGL